MPVIVHRTPGFKARRPFFLMFLLVKPLLLLWPLAEAGLRALRVLERAAERGSDVAGVRRERITLADRRTDRMIAADASEDTTLAVLYLHGGAFIACGPATHRQVIGRLALKSGLPVYALDYRQLPEAGVGTSVEDAMTAYRELLQTYDRVVVAGDSAGGYLSAKVVELSHLRGLPKPVAFIGISPLLDLDLGSNPLRTSRHDAYLPKGKMVKLAPKFDRGPVALEGVRSVMKAPTEAFPPTLIVTAQDEFLEPDCLELVERLSAAGVRADLHSFPWQVHAFPAVGVPGPDGPEAIALFADFIRDCVAVDRDSVTTQAS